MMVLLNVIEDELQYTPPHWIPAEFWLMVQLVRIGEAATQYIPPP